MGKEYFCNPVNVPYRYQFNKPQVQGNVRRCAGAGGARSGRPFNDSVSREILYFRIYDAQRMDIGGYGALGKPPSAGITSVV